MAALRRRDLWRTFLRSLWLQASWSFRGLQGLGFAYAMEPVLARLYGNGPEGRAARLRHLEFFNTHPFLAAAVLGCCARLEEGGGPDVEVSVRRLKGVVMGPWGALGDSVYWGSLRPLLLTAAAAAAWRGVLWAPAAFVAAFVAANLGGRLYGFWQGYRKGPGVVQAVAGLDLPRWARRGKELCGALLGLVMVGLVSAEPIRAWGIHPAVWVAGAGGSALWLAWVLRRGVRLLWLVYLVALLSTGIVTWT